MKCLNCGTELAEGTKFCGNCGTAVPAEPVVEEPAVTEVPMETAEAPVEATETVEAAKPEKEKGPSKVKLVLAAAAAKIKPVVAPIVDKCKPFVQKNKLWIAGGACLAILLITVLVIVSACNNGNGYTPFEHAIFAQVSDDGEVLVRYDNKKIIKTGIDAKSISHTQLSIDGNVLAFLTDENELVVVTGKKARVAAEDVTEFVLSVSGDGIGYVTKSEDGEATLKLYKVGSKNSVKVLDNYSYSDFDLSPDGKSIAYYKYNDEGEASLMYFNGSKHTKVTSNKVELIGLSNKGKYIYVTAYDEENSVNNIYSYNTKGNKQKLGNCLDVTYVFNEDHTQIMFYDGKIDWQTGIEAKTYVSNKGKEAKRLSSSLARPLIPNSSMTHSRGSVDTIPTDDLYNKTYTCYKDGQINVWLLKKNPDKSNKLVSNVSDELVLDESAKYLYYTNKEDELKLLKISHGDRAADKARLIAEDVENFVVTSDRSKVYYISDDALYSVNGKNGKSKKTVANEDVGYQLVLNQGDVCYYFVEGDVYACSDGKNGKPVVAEASHIDVSPNGIVYVETDDAMYASKTAKKPAKIHSYD